MALRINLPPVTRCLLAIIIALSLLYNVARYRASPAQPIHADPPAPPSKAIIPYLALVPSVAIFYPWTLLIATFVEQNIVTLLVNGVNVFFGGKYLERAWGTKEFIYVILISSLIPNILIVPTYALWGAITGNAERAMTPINGGITTQAAFLVAFKQLVPEHTVSIYKGVVKIRVKHFPAIFLAANTLGGFIFGTDTALLMAWYGLVTTWTYLRFYKRQPDLSGTSTGNTGVRGDASETFAFATFFPNAIQPPIAAVCNQIFVFLCNLRILAPFSDEDIAMGNEQAAARGESGLPNFNRQVRGARGMSKREEAERRRALALKALDERLSAAASRAAGPSAAPAAAPNLPEGQEMLGQTDYRPDE